MVEIIGHILLMAREGSPAPAAARQQQQQQQEQGDEAPAAAEPLPPYFSPGVVVATVRGLPSQGSAQKNEEMLWGKVSAGGGS